MSSLFVLGFRLRVLRVVAPGVTVSRTGIGGMSNVSSGDSDSILNSLLVFFADPIEPRRVNVPSAKTEAVIIDSVASAMRFDVKRVITYC